MPGSRSVWAHGVPQKAPSLTARALGRQGSQLPVGEDCVRRLLPQDPPGLLCIQTLNTAVPVGTCCGDTAFPVL